MIDNQIVESSFTVIIDAPIEKIDIPAWCLHLPESEYQACSPVTRELSAKDIGGGKSELKNRVRSHATEEFMVCLAQQGIPFDQFRAQRLPASIAHNQGETPLFAASIERAARRN